MYRCEGRELLDTEHVSDEVLAQAYRELRTINFWLGNTSTVLRLLRQETASDAGRVRRVLDIGCGQGALLLEIRRRLGVEVVGFDLRPAPPEAPVPILTGNAVADPLPEADVAVCVMMAHHLSEVELTAMIRNVGLSCRRFILLDLVRHSVPLVLFRAFVAPLLGRINAQDGATSIRRAYTAAELRRIVDGALAGHSKASGLPRPVSLFRHTVSPFWIRQVVDISWAAEAVG